MPVSALTHRLKTGAFHATLCAILERKARISAMRVRGFRLGGFAGKMTLLTLLMFLLKSGVESNPGPYGPSLSRHSGSYFDPHNSGGSCLDFSEQLNAAVERIQGTMERSLGSMESKLTARLDRMEENQQVVKETVLCLSEKCKALEEENQALRSDVGFLLDKNDYIENQSRRNNLVFVGIPKLHGQETWKDCEDKVLEIIHQGMGVSTDTFIDIERAHRAGKAIVVKFLSYKQKMSVLSCAKNLKNSRRFSRVYVNEDFSLVVKRKRAELRKVQMELRDEGRPSALRFDKLVAGDSIFTVDSDYRVHEQRRRFPRSWHDHQKDQQCYPELSAGAEGGCRDAHLAAPGQQQKDGEWPLADHEAWPQDPGNEPGDREKAAGATTPGPTTPPQASQSSAQATGVSPQRDSGQSQSPNSSGRGRGRGSARSTRQGGQQDSASTPLRGFGRGSPLNSGHGRGDGRNLWQGKTVHSSNSTGDDSPRRTRSQTGPQSKQPSIQDYAIKK